MTVSIRPTVDWIPLCFEENRRHLHVSAYLIHHGDHHILFDTGPITETETVLDEVDQLTNGSGVDTLVLSHPDLPHSGNVRALRSAWDDLELVVFSNTPPLHGFDDATRCERGDDVQIAGHRFGWIEAPLADITSTAWMYDYTANVLFTADGFGHYHRPGECEKTSRTLDRGVGYREINSFNRDVFAWMKYADPEKLEATFTAFFDAYPIEYVAPVHGNPIHGNDLEQYLDTFYQVVEDIAHEYVYPTERGEE